MTEYFKWQMRYIDCMDRCLKKRSREECRKDCDDFLHCLICDAARLRRKQ